MADIQTQNNVETPAGVAYYPQSSSVDAISLITISGQRVELKKMMMELSYFEDIDYREEVVYLKGFAVSDKIIKTKLIEFSLS